MAQYLDDYYSPPPFMRQPSGTRSSSTCSTSSSISSYSTPYGAMSNHTGSTPRDPSPASSVSDYAPGAIILAKNHYQGTPNHHQLNSSSPHLQASSLMPNPSQYLQAHVIPSPPIYHSVPTARQFSPPSPYGYPFASLSQQPSPLSCNACPAIYPSFSTTAYHSSPALGSYQTSPRLLPVVASSEALVRFDGLKMWQRLPPEITAEIQKHFTWFQCWKIYAVCRFFRDNFHPDRLPRNTKLEGMLHAEQSYGRWYEDNDSKRTLNKSPKWFGCYHCFRVKGFEHFEQQGWTNSPREADNNSSRPDPTYSTQPYSPPPSANPHYDPSLTRSGLAAAASSNNGLARDRPSAGSENPRMRETWGKRRFCVDCGLEKGWYKPGDVIELHTPLRKREALWVCSCRKFRLRPHQLQCPDCNDHIPLSTPPWR